ncbi:hypothetical protein [Planomicrobium okeanokoites]|uniref:hypothetical protein n=1 Tax=Planomicrobium okeanokoites TaxID=244 RepID=UPI0030FCAB46
MKKPKIDPESIVNSSAAVKHFDEVMKKAKETPQFIAENEKVELVVLDFTLYERMSDALLVLRELAWEEEIARRVEHSVAHPEDSLSLEEALGKEAAERILKMDPEDIADEDLFE